MDKNRSVWEALGDSDPYYAVATHEEFHKDNIDHNAKEIFFALGEEHLAHIWDRLERELGPLRPQKAVDYGCGVGRILFPMAERCENVIGVDVSRSMLAEAERNAAAYDINNVEFQDTEQFAAQENGRYDLVHTFIVMQHIPPQIGYKVIDTLIGRLVSGGAGMIHVTYRNNAPFFRKLRFRIFRDIPYAHAFSNFVQRRDATFMPMYEYDLARVEGILKSHSCSVIGTEDTDHGFAGRMFFIKKG